MRHVALLLVAAAATSGCGSELVHELPPAAEPARSPALTATPAGRLVTVGSAPEGLAADPVSHTFAVATREPSRLDLVDARSGRVRRSIPLPGASRHLAFDHAASAFVVPAETADRVARPSRRPVTSRSMSGRRAPARRGGGRRSRVRRQ